MEAVFLHIVNIAITASWLVLAVLLLRFVLKKAPKWATCLLWGIVALRLLLPFSLESAFSLIPNAEPIPESIIITETPTVNNGLEGADQVPNQVPGEVPDQVPEQVPEQIPEQIPDSVISGSLAPMPGDSVDPVQVLVFAASIVWLVGILLMLSYGAVSYFRLKRKVSASLCKEGRIYLCDNIDTPFILGILRPRIYLPSGMAESEIPYVLAHEEAHLRRKDHLWKPLGFLLLAVYWFNPLFWVAYILLCRDIENACDEKAIKDSDKAYKVSYSEALLACSIHRRTIMACPLAFGETGVKSRIRAVLHYKKPAFWVILVAILVLIVTCVCFLTNPVTEKDEDTTAVSTTETPTTTTTPTTSTIPVTTQTADSTQSVPALQNEIEMLAENAHWLKIHRMGNVQYIKDKNGDQYTLTLTLNFLVNPGLQIPEEVQSPVKPIAAETMRVFLKNLTKDKDYTEYKVTELRQSDRWCDVWITLDGFVPEKGSEYDIAIFFSAPEGAEIPGELVYAYLPEPWTVRYVSGSPDSPGPPDPVATAMEHAWWNEIQTDYRGFWQRSPDGAWHYIWPMTLKEKSNFFPILPEDHPVYPGKHTLELTTAEGAFAYIKDVNKDKDYTKYMVTGWTVNGNNLAFEAEGFVPTADGAYDMLLFFVAPEYSTHPGEYIYVWGLEETWYFNLPSIDNHLSGPMACAAESYRCNLESHSTKYDRTHTATNPENFPENTFNLTIKSEDGFFPTAESFQKIKKEFIFVYLKSKIDVEFVRYEIDYLLLEGNSDMWFTIKDFLPVSGEPYEMYVFFRSGEGAAHENMFHYVYASDWVTGNR